MRCTAVPGTYGGGAGPYSGYPATGPVSGECARCYHTAVRSQYRGDALIDAHALLCRYLARAFLAQAIPELVPLGLVQATTPSHPPVLQV